ncbi:MAG: hypothetical protein FRX48_02375 [Lasallia pustulata]|uniref:Hydroxyneurosporene synthase n=1 Tax=Lasallia pustulata TaxID=136370 RepID=A0A5M8PWG3_9LECA|nr:MAG: hypothetical protein FRX48_02375 [Lasallia pustulata]
MAFSRLNLFLALLLLTPPHILAHHPRKQPPQDHTTQNLVTTIPATTLSGPSLVQFTSNASGLDGAKVSPINGSVFDWWYFDAVSSDGLSSVVIIFFTLPSAAFPLDVSPDVVSISFSANFANGSAFSTGLTATEAVIMTLGDGSVGRYVGANASWWGGSDMEWYDVGINAPEAGVVGRLKLKSVAPAHYPCGPVGPGQDMQILPHVGWSNAVPDADAIADFTLGGSPLAFSGPGYHDKNWGDQPFYSSVSSWYWGHGRLGPYSIVWFDALDITGTEYVSSYVAFDGRIVTATCSGISVRPTGANDTYPPTYSSGPPSGFYIEVDLGVEGVLQVNVTATVLTVAVEGLYYRWTGTLEGGVKGGEVLSGAALWEEFP